MSLLAYSLRRAAGSLLVLLLVIWLLLFAVAHIGPVPYHPVERGPLFELPWNTLQPVLAHTWNIGALEVGMSVLVVLGFVGLWRLRPTMQRFWVVVATGSVLLAFGAASFGVALANQDYRRLVFPTQTYERTNVPPAIQRGLERRFNHGIDPIPWWLAGGISTSVGALLLGASALAKRREAAR